MSSAGPNNNTNSNAQPTSGDATPSLQRRQSSTTWSTTHTATNTQHAGAAAAARGRAFWRVSYGGHHQHAAFHHHMSNVFHRDIHRPFPPAAAQPPASSGHTSPAFVSIPSPAHDGDSAAVAHRYSPQPAGDAAPRPLHAFAVRQTHMSPGEGTGESHASSFDVVDSMPRSRLPSVRSMGSLVVVGSPDHRQGGRVASFGSLAPTPTARSVNLNDLDGARPSHSPVSGGTGVSFPSVSTNTPQASPAATRCGTPAPAMRSPQAPAPGAAGVPPLRGLGRSPPSFDDMSNSPLVAAEVRRTLQSGPGSSNSSSHGAVAPMPQALRFRVVDGDGREHSVGFKHGEWDQGLPGGGTGPAFVTNAVAALLRAMRARSDDIPPTPPNSECGDDEEDEEERESRSEAADSGDCAAVGGSTPPDELDERRRLSAAVLEESAPRWSSRAWRVKSQRRLQHGRSAVFSTAESVSALAAAQVPADAIDLPAAAAGTAAAGAQSGGSSMTDSASSMREDPLLDSLFFRYAGRTPSSASASAARLGPSASTGRLAAAADHQRTSARLTHGPGGPPGVF